MGRTLIGNAADWDARYAETGLLWSAQPNRFLVAELGGAPPGTALDLACGEGRNAVWLATRGWKVTAVDHSEVGVEKATDMAASAGVAVDWVVADVTSYRAPGRFDLVAMLYLHLPPTEMRAAIANAESAVDDGGTLLVVGHHSDNIEDGIGGPQVPEILYRPEDVVSMLDRLEVVTAEQVRRPATREGREGIALDTLVRARRS